MSAEAPLTTQAPLTATEDPHDDASLAWNIVLTRPGNFILDYYNTWIQGQSEHQPDEES